MLHDTSVTHGIHSLFLIFRFDANVIVLNLSWVCANCFDAWKHGWFSRGDIKRAPVERALNDIPFLKSFRQKKT